MERRKKALCTKRKRKVFFWERKPFYLGKKKESSCWLKKAFRLQEKNFFCFVERNNSSFEDIFSLSKKKKKAFLFVKKKESSSPLEQDIKTLLLEKKKKESFLFAKKKESSSSLREKRKRFSFWREERKLFLSRRKRKKLVFFGKLAVHLDIASTEATEVVWVFGPLTFHLTLFWAKPRR